MVMLVPMTEEEFERSRRADIQGYAQDKVRSGNWPSEGALERAMREEAQLLPDGLHTKDHFFYSIVEETTGQKVGTLWVHITMDTPHRDAFLFNIQVDEQFRGQGYGSQALLALDKLLARLGVESLGLHVFGFNTRAFELYKRVGFEVTNINMRKVYPSE